MGSKKSKKSILKINIILDFNANSFKEASMSLDIDLAHTPLVARLNECHMRKSTNNSSLEELDMQPKAAEERLLPPWFAQMTIPSHGITTLRPHHRPYPLFPCSRTPFLDTGRTLSSSHGDKSSSTLSDIWGSIRHK